MTFDNKLYLAPLDKTEIRKALDIATGTGIWAIELASEIPTAKVIGTDLSPIQPKLVPDNCRFPVDDAEDPWQYEQSFNLIHARMVAACFKSHHRVFQSAFENLDPGGYLELQDTSPFECIDDSENGTAFLNWRKLANEGVKSLGLDFDQVSQFGKNEALIKVLIVLPIAKAPLYKSYMEEIGFVDVVQKKFAWPIGPWAKVAEMKKIGIWTREDVLQGMQGWTMAALTRGLGMAKPVVEKLLVAVKKEILSGKIHTYMPIWVVYGRKPETS
ncbi:hypothetical protein BP5796_00703 [Coleophoma crateriformis]|uniref:S-adenosyl-L-methionine-dependent methyltransferase n=1 Tax=Coleophoma crateriformis TaxID=565419 RepID=A0A3D8T8R1_9HELO|nr:hypothetical protein BP5796_00703 [Coleophoma crateriformis]